MRLLNYLADAAGCVIYGVLIAIVLVGVLMFIVRALQSNKSFSIFSFLLAFVLGVFLSFQMTLMVGAFGMKGYCDDIETVVDDIVASYGEQANRIVGREQVDETIDRLECQFPFLKAFVNVDEFRNCSLDEVCGVLLGKFRHYFNQYIVRRILWASLAVVLAGVVLYATMDNIRPRRALARCGRDAGTARMERRNGSRNGSRRRVRR